MVRGMLLIALTLSLGCGPAGPALHWVEGTATWQGEKIPDGDITFISQDPTIADDSGKITDGKFRFQAKAGKKKVTIHAVREEGEVDPVMGVKPRKPYIPPEYSSEQSQLQAEVKPGVANTFDFHLPLK